MTISWQQLDNIFSQFAICWSMLTALNSQVRCAPDDVLFPAWLPHPSYRGYLTKRIKCLAYELLLMFSYATLFHFAKFAAKDPI